VGFVEAEGLGILNPGVSRSRGCARADISAVRSPCSSSIGRGCRHLVPRKSVTPKRQTEKAKTSIWIRFLVGGPVF